MAYHPLLAVIAGTPDITGVVAHARMIGTELRDKITSLNDSEWTPID